MSVQYTAIFHGCKNDNFQMKFFDIFLIFAQNIDCVYVRTASNPSFTKEKWGVRGCSLHGLVFVMTQRIGGNQKR